MRKYNPNDIDDNATALEQDIPAWMLEAVQTNPDYVWWGNFEDHMMGGGQWSSPIEDDASVQLPLLGTNDLNEIVNFYFEAERPSCTCTDCEGSGYNPKTKDLADGFYDHSAPGGRGWQHSLTTDEIEMLESHGRNRAGGIFGHDAINRTLLVECRAKRLGIYGDCPTCQGHGNVFTQDTAVLNLQLWKLHPRKGASRGWYIRNIQQDQLPEIYRALRAAAERNAQRFARIPVID